MTDCSLLFTDFKGFAKPLRLLPATGATICTELPVKELCTYLEAEPSSSFYIVQLSTSNDYGSGLSSPNSTILLCLIAEDGNSILQRIPAALPVTHGPSGDMVASDYLCFQRGSNDMISFRGPKLGEIDALWIGLESGSWRLGSLSLRVIFCSSQCSNTSSEGEMGSCMGFEYGFESRDILLGDAGVSMTELRPCLKKEFSGMDVPSFLNSVSDLPTLQNYVASLDESMKEYADLKLSLLLYDAMLILFGTSAMALSNNERIASSFLVGGVCGFLYLLLLQRSVDKLPGQGATSSVNSEESEKEYNAGQAVQGFKGPLTSLALTLGLAITGTKFIVSGSTSVVLAPQELLVGVAGFLACKMAVVLAAFKPLQTGWRENK
ncbi:hypothetical protein AMTR_s00133p00113640 [Amborella trichopoda]|uniref:DUF7755 domain-containing protein n=1 Tax=Amborella trichopoda TaxID=13333 RepID=W1P3K9_AMBTC|nr:hypothetical protein AMTR_s00133p00113640 [Amborella trichopoda]